jgi:chemotaxis protein methyltransferase CheR
MRERLLAQDIVATSREPLLILDQRLTVLLASRSFGAAFDIDEEAIVGLSLIRIANGRLNIPPLTERLARVLSGEATIEDFEVRQDTASGPRTFLIHASALGSDGSEVRPLMLTMEDVTERRKFEADCEDAMRRASDMVVEFNHRAMNSFAMIGAILAMEARWQQDELCRAAFNRMQARIASIAHLYRTLGRGHSSESVGSDEYLKTIVDDLIASLSDPSCKVEVSFSVDKTLLPVRLAVPVGLLVNEIVTNSLKHAFTGRAHGRIGVAFAPDGEHHVLRISDDGRGIDASAGSGSGLGRRLSEAFAQQLRGTVEHTSGPHGTTVVLRFPRADVR